MHVDGSLFSKLEQVFQTESDRPAFVTGGCVVTYGELNGRVSQYANALRALGVSPGDRVMVQVEKSIANVAVYLATLKIGAVFNPLNTAYTAAELAYFIGDAKPAVLVVDPSNKDGLEPVAKEAGVGHVETLGPDGSGSLASLAAKQPTTAETVARARDDLAALLYTSGTTGRSKGAMITHENLLSNAETLVDYWGFEGGDTLIHALPIFHVHGLFVALNTAFLSASKMLWLEKFDADAVLNLMPDATVLMGVPTFYTRLLASDGLTRACAEGMRLFVAGSAPLLAETHDAFTQRTGHRIVERYGMTEAGMITSNPYHTGERQAGTVGFALPGIDVRIATEDGVVLGTDDVGVLEVRGPNVFKGYWQMPDKTAAEFRNDGFFISGDLATIASDGRVTIVGRAKDLIITGGYNVYPKEIETELNAIDGIGESAVIGVPHPDFGEGVVAVVTKDGAGAEIDADAIVGQLAARLAKFKQPKRVFVVDVLPRNAMGKVQKAELRSQFETALTDKQ
ncbi:MAG: malonyl-CoA synthase [Pseudomonadota bacterium]